MFIKKVRRSSDCCWCGSRLATGCVVLRSDLLAVDTSEEVVHAKISVRRNISGTTMRYVSAYMLATMGTKHHHITTNDIENILGSVGIDCEREKAEEIIKKMQGKTLDELIIEGSKYLSSVSPTAPCIDTFVVFV
ncbi:unnamed protein product [Onchocerca ochengi]|uniref:Large ribosomal subunit protein P2 n=1 Tax=Onchocerca ochengi TaxID=42157 RepID=A0A182ENB7_ONCOC|nr:unnamed protein product [Onchocerca ochengi]